MFTLVESREEIALAQRTLESTIRRDFKTQVSKNIGYKGGTQEKASVFTDGIFWHWSSSKRSEKDKIPRFLNWFGIFDQVNDLHITVEINVPIVKRTRQVAGFFARDSNTGSIYLFHSGDIKGGRKGVGKTAFLAWGQQIPVEVADSTGGIRDGILIMPITGLAASRPAVRYIKTVANFKSAVRAGYLRSPSFKRMLRDYENFRSESSGRRKGRRSSEIDYISRHGDVVEALKTWRSSNKLPNRGHIFNNLFIDLGVRARGNVVEVFEVKTSCNRQDCYTAIGQLIVHGASANCIRVIVLPLNERIPGDIMKTLQRMKIKTMRYELDTTSVTILAKARS